MPEQTDIKWAHMLAEGLTLELGIYELSPTLGNDNASLLHSIITNRLDGQTREQIERGLRSQLAVKSYDEAHP